MKTLLAILILTSTAMGQVLVGVANTEKFVTLDAPPATWVTMIDDTMDKLVARWAGTPGVTSGIDTALGPFSPTSITSVGTTATVTIPNHIFHNLEDIGIHRADGYADKTEGGYNNFESGGTTEPVVSNATTNTFTYEMTSSTGDADATGNPVILRSPWSWWTSNSGALGYYAPYYNLIGYCDWLDRTGRKSSTSFRDARFRPMNSELARWQFGAAPNGYSRMYQSVYKAYLENETWLGSPVTLALVKMTHETGAYGSPSIAPYVTNGDIYKNNLQREWAYTLAAMVGAERCGDTRHTEILNLKDAILSHIYQSMWETTREYPKDADPSLYPAWAPSTVYSVGDWAWKVGNSNSSAESGDTVSFIDTSSPKTDGYWNGAHFVWTSGSNAGTTSQIGSYTSATGRFTLYEALANSVSAGDSYEIQRTSLYQCTTTHTSGATWDYTKWSSLPTQGDGGFMFAISSNALIHFYDWEIENGRDPDAQWPTTLRGYNDDITTTVVNPWGGLLECLQEYYKWIFNYSGLSGDVSSVDRDVAYNAGYFRRIHPYYFGDPSCWMDGIYQKTIYRSLAHGDESNTLLSMSASTLYWLADSTRNSDLALAQWFADRGDAILETAGLEYPYIIMGNTGAIKEGNQRIWYIFDALTSRNNASNRSD